MNTPLSGRFLWSGTKLLLTFAISVESSKIQRSACSTFHTGR